jgi:hypothetical protein
VKDVANSSIEYYVAAWYVKAADGQLALGVKDQGTVSYSPPAAVEPEPLVIRTAVDGLALRTLPLIMEKTLIKRMPMDTEMVVLEDPKDAEAKLGKMGEWFHVCEVRGVEGYAAAWYSIKRPDPIIDDTKPIPG